MSFKCPHCPNHSTHQPSEVYAEMQNVRALPGTGIGGGIGILAGPLGVIIGLIGGTAVAWGIENKAVNEFNASSA